MKVEVGERASYERTFTNEEVQAFTELSGDRGIHHMRPDPKGRIMIQGLLTATLPTKLGGDLNFIAAEMTFKFLRPVFAGDTIKCEAVVRDVEAGDGRLKVAMDFVCTNQLGAEVLVGSTRGVVMV